MSNIVVIGASGEVGRGVVEVLLQRGHHLIAVGRHSSRLTELAEALGQPEQLRLQEGSVENDAAADKLRKKLAETSSRIDGIIISINAPRRTSTLQELSSEEFANVLRSDAVTHFTAAKALIPILTVNGSFIGIGGGSADFILEDGAALSVAQAGLRMLYRALAHEFAEQPVHIHELIIASVVNSTKTRAFADPHWVTEIEIGEQIAAILETPTAFTVPIWRLSRRPAPNAPPVFSAEPPNRIQGFRQAQAVLP